MIFEPIIDPDLYFYKDDEKIKLTENQDPANPEPFSFKRLKKLREKGYSGFSHYYLVDCANKVDLHDESEVKEQETILSLFV